MSGPDEIRALSPTGMLGSGFLEASLEVGMSWDPHFIGCDAGTTDGGPFYLGSGGTMFSRQAVKRDVGLMLSAARAHSVPLIIGSAGTGGSDAQVEWLAGIVTELAAEAGLHFRLGRVWCEQQPDYLLQLLAQDRIHPLPPSPQLVSEQILASRPIVAMAGVEPFQWVLAEGADVVIAGRASDTSIFAAVPVSRGIPPAVAWHAAKILECGAAAVTQRTHPDCMFGWLRQDEFVVEPCNPGYRSSPQSVASHSLYETADPFRLHEPSGVLDTTRATYEAESDRAVRVRGSEFQPADCYTVRLEGTELLGYQTVILGAVRDPLILGQLGAWLDGLERAARQRVDVAFPGVQCELRIRVYGRDGVLGSAEPHALPAHEVLLVFEATAGSQEMATAIAKSVMHIALHYPVPEWHGLITGLALPYSPPELERGAVYRFSLNHIAAPHSPEEMFRVELECV